MGSLLNSNDVDKNYTVIVTSGLLLNFLLLQKLLIKREFLKKEVNSPVILPPKYQSHHSGMMLLDHHPPLAKCTPAAGVPPQGTWLFLAMTDIFPYCYIPGVEDFYNCKTAY